MYAICILGFTILTIGLWGDLTRPHEEEVFFTSLMLAVPLFIVSMVLCWLYYYLHKQVKNGLLFWLKEITFLHVVCVYLYSFLVLLPPLPFLRSIASFESVRYFFYVLSKIFFIFLPTARYLFITTQAIALVLLIIVLIRKNKA